MTDLDTGAADAPAPDDLRAAIESAWTDDTAQSPQPKAEPKPETPPAKVAAEPDKDRPRNPDGTFAEKPKEAAGDKPVSADPGKTAPETGTPATRKPPASWSKEFHAHWDRLDPAIQDQILKRESDVAKGFEEKAAKYKPYDELEPLLAPKRQQWRLNGWSDAQALQQLIAAQEYLERDPVGGIVWLAKSYGVRPEHLFPQQQPAASNQQDNPLAQYLAPVFQELNQVKSAFTAAQQAERTRQETALVAQVESFSKDHPHMDAVAREMMEMLKIDGQPNALPAKRLQDAYDKAVWLNPDIRQKVLDEQAQARSEQARKDAEIAAQETARARRASSSVTGGPTGNGPNAPKATLREELEAAYG